MNGLSVLPVGVKSFGATMLLALGLSKCIICALQYHTFNPCIVKPPVESTLPVLIKEDQVNTCHKFGSEYLLHCLLQIFICSSFTMVISQQFTSSPDSGYQMAF